MSKGSTWSPVCDIQQRPATNVWRPRSDCPSTAGKQILPRLYGRILVYYSARAVRFGTIVISYCIYWLSNGPLKNRRKSRINVFFSAKPCIKKRQVCDITISQDTTASFVVHHSLKNRTILQQLASKFDKLQTSNSWSSPTITVEIRQPIQASLPKLHNVDKTEVSIYIVH